MLNSLWVLLKLLLRWSAFHMDPNLANTITDYVMYDSDLQTVDSCDLDACDWDSYSFMGLLMLFA
jgi:hypothetical protein